MGDPTKASGSEGPRDTFKAIVSVVQDYFELPHSEAEEMASELQSIHLAGGETLFKQGDHADSMYLVVRGRLQVWIDTDSPIYIGEVVPGESVGEVGLITGEARSADVVAVRSCILIKFEQSDFERLAPDIISMGRERSESKSSSISISKSPRVK